MTVSVVTISQRGRFPVLKILVKILLSQTIKPNEWVIVEGSKNEEDAKLHAEDIATIKVPFTLRYLPYEAGLKLGGLRNRGNEACKSDIIVCMDDDDFYPSDRIEHVVEQFRRNPSINIAGCSNVLLYDYSSKTMYQCIGFHGNHSTNNAMAWRSIYLKTHKHDPEKSNAEEASFTNQFVENMIPLEPTKTVIVSSHTNNTFDKRNLIQFNPRFKVIAHSALYAMMPEAFYQEYLEFFEKQIQKQNEAQKSK